MLGLELAADSPRLFASLLPPEEKKAEALRWGAAFMISFHDFLRSEAGAKDSEVGVNSETISKVTVRRCKERWGV